MMKVTETTVINSRQARKFDTRLPCFVGWSIFLWGLLLINCASAQEIAGGVELEPPAVEDEVFVSKDAWEGMTNIERTKILQKVLAREGLYEGEYDGIFGPKTREGAERRAEDLGVVGVDLLAHEFVFPSPKAGALIEETLYGFLGARNRTTTRVWFNEHGVDLEFDILHLENRKGFQRVEFGMSGLQGVRGDTRWVSALPAYVYDFSDWVVFDDLGNLFEATPEKDTLVVEEFWGKGRNSVHIGKLDWRDRAIQTLNIYSAKGTWSIDLGDYSLRAVTSAEDRQELVPEEEERGTVGPEQTLVSAGEGLVSLFSEYVFSVEDELEETVPNKDKFETEKRYQERVEEITRQLRKKRHQGRAEISKILSRKYSYSDIGLQLGYNPEDQEITSLELSVRPIYFRSDFGFLVVSDTLDVALTNGLFMLSSGPIDSVKIVANGSSYEGNGFANKTGELVIKVNIPIDPEAARSIEENNNVTLIVSPVEVTDLRKVFERAIRVKIHEIRLGTD